MEDFDEKIVNVVYDDNLQAFLMKLGVYDDIMSGHRKCKFTGIPITQDNFYSVLMSGGDIKFVSDDPRAIKLFSEFLNFNNNHARRSK